MSVICTNKLSKSYGRRRGITDVNLVIEAGEIFGFLGPNGAGKSTTIRVLLGFLQAGQGTSTIFDKDCWAKSHVIKQDVGYVAGDVRHYPWLTARKALRLVGQVRGLDLGPAGQELAERFDLEIDLPVRKMSRGNRQKLALVLGLVHRPKLVVLDEPTSGLDPLMQDLLADCLRELAKDGHTVFFSSHTISEVENLCDRVAIIRDGTIVVDERIPDLKIRSPRTVTISFRTSEDAENAHWPQFLTLQRRHKTECELEMTGSAIQFTDWAVTQPMADLTIGPPSLEALFRGYYRIESKAN